MSSNFMLPQEMMIKIFQNLSIKELLLVSEVCREWNELSRSPLLWKRVKVNVHENKILQFCEFMKSFKMVEIFWFQVIWSENYYLENKKPEIESHILHAINDLILCWPKLTCLCLSQEISLNIIPHTIKHIMYVPVHPPYHNVDRVNDRTLLLIANQRCIDEIRICHVHIARYTEECVENLLEMKKSCIKCLSLDCYTLKKQSLSLLRFCLNLTKLSLNNCITLDENSLAGIASLKQLKYFNVNEVCNFSNIMCNVLKQSTFISLEYLLISHCESITSECFSLMVKKIPILNTFGLNSCKVIREDLIKYLNDSKLIKYIAFDASIADFDLFLEDIDTLNHSREFHSICFCDIGSAFDNDIYNRHRTFIKTHFVCHKCLFAYPNQYFVCNC